MMIEKYLQRFFGVKLALYTAPERESPGLGNLQEEKLTQYRNEEVRKLGKEIESKTDLSADDKAKAHEVLKKVDDTLATLSGVTSGQRIVGKRIEILGKVRKIGTPQDPEYDEILKKIESLSTEQAGLKGQETKLKELVDNLKKQFEALFSDKSVEGKDVKTLEMLGISQDQKDKVTFDDRKNISAIGEGVILNVNIPEKNDKDVTLGRLLPANVSEITIGDKKYKRLGRTGEFVSTDPKDKKFLQLADVKNAKITGVRNADDVKKLTDEVNAIGEGKELKDKIIAKKAKEYGLDEERLSQNFTGYLERAKEAGEEIDEARLQSDEAYVTSLVEQCALAGAFNTESYKVEDMVDPKNEEEVRRFAERRIKNDMVNNTGRWVQNAVESGKKVPKFLQILNDLFMKITGFDLLGLSPQEQQRAREFMGSMIGGPMSNELGSLSERFESGGKGSSVIVEDSDGAGNKFLSYGTYQINRERLKAFVAKNKDFLGLNGVTIDEKWYSSSQKEGNPIYKAWSEKAAADPTGFKKLEHEFVKATYFDPVIKAVGSKVDFTKFPVMVQNVIWSTAVQHGEGSIGSKSGAIPIVLQALESVGGTMNPNDFTKMKKFVEEVYRIRGTYRNSTPGRYAQEQQIVLANLSMVENNGGDVLPGTPLGEALAQFMEKEGFKCFEGGAMCGKNVGLMLIDFARKSGNKELLDALNTGFRGRRDGYRYTEFFNTPPLNQWFEKRPINNPMQAPRGGVLVYDTGYGIGDRRGYGHVEIATGGGGFYFGKRATKPGGSINAAANPAASGFTGFVYCLKQPQKS